jgi:hypothetical protein
MLEFAEGCIVALHISLNSFGKTLLKSLVKLVEGVVVPCRASTRLGFNGRARERAPLPKNFGDVL